ncbi:MAG TPA: rod shape-determining protein MreD [Thermohalobaculum sp.]|nr:rod shape-determining protein MreD [Thermohalobaculum sp.]
MRLAAALAPARLAAIAFVLALGLVAVAVESAPLGLEAGAWPSPDLLFCIIAYWSLRRPDAVPLVAVFAAGLGRDLLTDAAVGAGALGLALAAEALKSAGRPLARRSPWAEWLAVAGTLAAMLLFQWLLVLLALTHPPYLVDLARQWLLTVALYPPLAAIFHWLLRIRRAPAEEG